MTNLERTRQQLDPVGGLGHRLSTVIVVSCAMAYAIYATVSHLTELSSPPLAALSLLWLFVAWLVVVVGTSSRRGPFTRNAHIVVHLLALGSIALSVASEWDLNTAVQDDFGPVALGLLILAMGPYRPAAEIAGAGVLSAIFVGFLTLLEAPFIVASTAPPLIYVLASAAPLLAAAFASSTYSRSMVRELERWREDDLRDVAASDEEVLGGIERSVQQDRVTVLGRDVLPFFNTILQHGSISEDDRARARTIADSIRSIMVAEADRSWLELLFSSQNLDLPPPEAVVSDPAGCAAGMATEQRTALRAVIVAVSEESSYVENTLRIGLRKGAGTCHGVLRAEIGASDFESRSLFLPYVALMRVVFSDVRVEFRHSTLTLEFAYEQR